MSVYRWSISGDWTEIKPGIRVRLQDAPNEEDMQHYDPQGIVILQVEISDEDPQWFIDFMEYGMKDADTDDQ